MRPCEADGHGERGARPGHTVTAGHRPHPRVPLRPGRGDGLVHVFVPHATAGVAIFELGAGSDPDLDELLDRVFPRDGRWVHQHGSPGHGADHLVPVLVSPSISMPVLDGQLALGTWQSVALVDTNVDNPAPGAPLLPPGLASPRDGSRARRGPMTELAATGEGLVAAHRAALDHTGATWRARRPWRGTSPHPARAGTRPRRPQPRHQRQPLGR